MNFIIRFIGSFLLLMPFLISTSQAIALYSTLTETLYMDCVQHSSGMGPAYRADLKLTSTSNKGNKTTEQQILIPIQFAEMSHTKLCQLGVDPVFNSTGSIITVNIPQFDVVDNNGDYQGSMNAQLTGDNNLNFNLTGLTNLNQTQVIPENRPRVSVTDIQPRVIHKLNFTELGICLIVKPEISPDDNIELNVHVALSMGNSEPGNILSIPRVLINDSSTAVIGGLTTIFNYGNYTAVPVLSDIPILGYIFKHDQGASSKRNLMIMVTAQVVDCLVN